MLTMLIGGLCHYSYNHYEFTGVTTFQSLSIMSSRIRPVSFIFVLMLYMYYYM